MPDAVALLQQLGFGEYEARIYLALLQQSPLNGYEVAKVSGVPRANVYAVLQKLEERGAVVRQEAPGSTRYAPVAPEELTSRLGRRFQDTLTTVQHTLRALSRPAGDAQVWNLRDAHVVLEHARALVDQGREHLLIALTPPEAAALANDLARAEARGIAIITLCLEACTIECGGCRGRIFRYRTPPAARQRWLVLVVDGAELLASEIAAGGEARAIRTQQRLLVDLISWYIRHSIALAALLDGLGERLDDLLDERTRAVLQAIGPAETHQDWLGHMRQILDPATTP